jgi:hypothetical protein
MGRAGTLPVGSYALPNSVAVCCLYHRLHNGVCNDGNTGPLIHWDGAVRSPEINSGKLPSSYMDLACQLGLWLPACTVDAYASIPPPFHAKV